MQSPQASLPLAGIRVLEVGGIGPGPFAGMMLAELGADVVRVDRPNEVRVLPGDHTDDLLNRGKRSIALDLKDPHDRDLLLDLAARADVLVEGFRPGVAERLGFGPDTCRRINGQLVYGRMTGWGQHGPRSGQAGHDINYIGLTGALDAMGTADGPPLVPLNLVGDFGGGALYLVVGILAALFEVERGGAGIVVDAAIIDGTSHLLTSIHSLQNVGAWLPRRGANLLDGGAPFYAVYETADHEHMAVGALERRFYDELLRVLDVDVDPERQNDRTTWESTRAVFAAAFRRRTREQWTDAFRDVDACVTPVIRLTEAPREEHLAARATVTSDAGRLTAQAAPRFEGIAPFVATSPPAIDADRAGILRDWLSDDPAVTRTRLGLARGLDAVLDDLDPDLRTAVGRVGSGGAQDLTLTVLERWLVCLAVAAAPTELADTAVEVCIRNCRERGASHDQMVEALLLASVAGFHTLTSYVARLLPHEDPTPLDDRCALGLRRKLQGDASYWDGFERHLPGFLDALLRSSPDAYEQFLEYSAIPWRTGVLSGLHKELVYVAINATPAHVYPPGLRIHVSNARKLGATLDDIALVLLIGGGVQRLGGENAPPWSVFLDA